MVPLTAPDKIIVEIDVPEQMVWDVGLADAFGVGFTITVTVIAAPLQPFANGVIVNVTVTGALVVFVNVPDILPFPFVAIPVTETLLSRVQLKVVPGTFPVSSMVAIELAEQIVCEVGAATTPGVGFTNTVAVIDAPVQPFNMGVMVNVTRTGVKVVFVRIPEISPEPLDAIPVANTN